MNILSDYHAMARDQVGGKFASQAEMRADGIQVPGFFCLSKQAFDSALAPLRGLIAEKLRGLDASKRRGVVAAAEAIEQAIAGLDMPAELAAEIEASFDNVLGECEYVSVRSSMIGATAETSEDSADNPFAGISESFLYVRREELLDRIKGCWASAYSERAILYRLTQGMDPTEVSVAVGVQKMVFGQRSFVMFTCDPNTTARTTLVTAGYGIGEGVVQEAVPVDHFFLDGGVKDRDIRRVVADKDTRMDLDREAGAGIKTYPVEDAKRKQPCLSDLELRRLAQFGSRIERLFGAPQDIEGTFTEDGEIHILQARPIAIDHARHRIWTNLNITESYPGVSRPLTYSVAKLFYRVIFKDMYRRFGVSEKEIDRNEYHLDRMIGYLGGRAYYSLNAFYRLHSMVPLFQKTKHHWEDMVGLRASYAVTPADIEGEGKRHGKLAMIASGLRILAMYPSHQRRMRRFREWWRGRAAESRALLDSKPDPLVVTEEFYDIWRAVGMQWGVTLVNDGYIQLLYGWTEKLFAKWGLDEDPTLLSNLLCGGESIESAEIFLSVLRLAERVREDQDARAIFEGESEPALLRRLREGSFPAAIQASLDAHIRDYGDRCMEELKMESPSLRDDPTALIRGIRRFLKSDLDAASFLRRETETRANAEQVLAQRLGHSRWRLPLIRLLLNEVRRVVAHRENSRYCRSELFGLCKDMFARLGEHLAARDAVEQPSDVQFLTIEEALGYADGTGVDLSFKDTVARRRAQVTEQEAQEVAETVVTHGAVAENSVYTAAPTVTGDGRHLSGLGSSRGAVRGVARVIHDPNEVDEIDPDTILVARETDPGWLFLMLACKGMIVERGSMLSHTAITGRKFGIPTIVGVEGATSLIPDGAALEMDGGAGTIVLTDQTEQATA